MRAFLAAAAVAALGFAGATAAQEPAGSSPARAPAHRRTASLAMALLLVTLVFSIVNVRILERRDEGGA